jgi:hypothetical protein
MLPRQTSQKRLGVRWITSTACSGASESQAPYLVARARRNTNSVSRSAGASVLRPFLPSGWIWERERRSGIRGGGAIWRIGILLLNVFGAVKGVSGRRLVDRDPVRSNFASIRASFGNYRSTGYDVLPLEVAKELSNNYFNFPKLPPLRAEA